MHDKMKNHTFLKINNTTLLYNTLLISELHTNNHLLTNQEVQKVDSFKCEKRKRTFIGVRELLNIHSPTETIYYNTIGAPYLKNRSSHISVSHSQLTCAIAFNPKNEIGLDIEFHTGQATRVRKRFIHEDEEFLCTNEKSDTLLWSAKEALYKIAQTKKIIFKTQLRLLAQNKDEFYFDAQILFSDGNLKNYTVFYREIDDLIITLAEEKKVHSC